MKKRITLILLCAMLAASASCGGNNNGSNQNTSAAQSTTTAAASNTAKTESTDAPQGETTTSAAETTAAPEATKAQKEIPEDTPYIIENGITDRMKALADYVDGNKARLAKVFKKAKAGEPITVAYLGGSITQGSTADYLKWYARLVTEWLQAQFPDSEITEVNAGIGATGSYIGVYRADRDVTCHNPDLVFIDFSVNDTTENTERNIGSYDGLLRKLWFSDSAPAIVTIAMTMEDGTSFQQYHADVCRAYDIPMISYREAILDVINNGHIKWTDISDDNIHPNTVGHSVLTEIITSYLQSVIDDLDNIDTEHESDFSAVYKTDKYTSATLLLPGCEESMAGEGWETKADASFGNFGGLWRLKMKEGVTDGIGTLKFETEAKSIGVFYGKLITNAGQFDVVVDGEKVKTIDCDFTGGWGNYVEAAEVIDFDECGKHTIEIVPHTGKKANINISAIAITK